VTSADNAIDRNEKMLSDHLAEKERPHRPKDEQPRPRPNLGRKVRTRTGRAWTATVRLMVHSIALHNGEQAMPRGRQPDGQHALSNAERQARYRARHQAEPPPPVVRYRRPTDRRVRPQRWREAAAELVALQAEYAAWFDALPESLRDSATAEALQAIVDLDLDVLTAIEPPRGYGRD
jgi:hypothetical protein